MITFQAALESVIDARQLTRASVAEGTGLQPSYVSGLLNGDRKIGPQILGSILSFFSKKEEQEILLSAYLIETISEVEVHMTGKKISSHFKNQLGGSRTIGSENLHVPYWLETLVEQSVALGVEDTNLQRLIGDLLSAAIRSKKKGSK